MQPKLHKSAYHSISKFVIIIIIIIIKMNGISKFVYLRLRLFFVSTHDLPPGLGREVVLTFTYPYVQCFHFASMVVIPIIIIIKTEQFILLTIDVNPVIEDDTRTQPTSTYKCMQRRELYDVK